MEKFTNAQTAWTSYAGMPVSGHPCARIRVLAVAPTAVEATAVADAAFAKAARPGSPAWRPLTS